MFVNHIGNVYHKMAYKVLKIFDLECGNTLKINVPKLLKKLTTYQKGLSKDQNNFAKC